MSEKPLLLSPAKSGVLLDSDPFSRWWRFGATTIGLFVVVIGAADATSRFAEKYLGDDATFFAFGPVAALHHESLFLNATTSASATTTPLTPARIRIDSINVNAPVERVGLKADQRTMAAPKDFNTIAWYEPGVMPGEGGRAVFAGHLNSPILSRVGIFSKLSAVEKGDRVVVSDESGRSLTYEVYKIDEYVHDIAPTAEIFSKEGPSEIVLITCEGEWDNKTCTFDKRLVVIARLVP